MYRQLGNICANFSGNLMLLQKDFSVLVGFYKSKWGKSSQSFVLMRADKEKKILHFNFSKIFHVNFHAIHLN